MRIAVRAIVLTLLIGCLFAPGCGGGGGGDPPPPSTTNWFQVDPSQPPGTPAKLIMDDSSSSDQGTAFELKIAGFFLVDKKGPDGQTYKHVMIPGLHGQVQPGAPNLPMIRFELAIVTDAKLSSLVKAEALNVKTFENVLVWPRTIPEVDHEDGDPEQFIRDESIYGMTKEWPLKDALDDVPVGIAMRSIPSCAFEAWPCKWNPSTRQLKIPQSVKYSWTHAGTPLNFSKTPITKERAASAALRFSNWRVAAQYIPVEFVLYLADFLFIYPEGYGAALAPLIAQKRTRGFKVTEHLLVTAESCNSIRTIIQNWEASVPVHHDAYCLLVGDTSWIPLCMQDSSPTDDLYASTNGDDLSEEVYLGRLSVDNAADCTNQVDKILAYEDTPSPFCCYPQVALWAHKQDAPGKYEGAHESVRTATYAVPPVFTTYYGSQVGVMDADITTHATNGLGLIAYRGHGSSSSTGTSWNQTVEYFNSSDVTNVMPSLNKAPPVWSFACTNTALGNEDCIGEVWMEKADGGAVSYYGATDPSGTTQNHELDRRMFKGVYDLGLVTQSHAIEYAEAQMAAIVGSSNAWLYLLLGDPDMQIRRRNPISIAFTVPEFIEYNPIPVPIEVRVTVGGTPLGGVLVGMYRPSPLGVVPPPGGQANGYTDPQGRVTLYIVPGTAKGSILVSVEDGKANSALGSIPILPGVD